MMSCNESGETFVGQVCVSKVKEKTSKDTIL